MVRVVFFTRTSKHHLGNAFAKFLQSDAKFIDMCNLMSPSYEPEIETVDQVAEYDGNYREP